MLVEQFHNKCRFLLNHFVTSYCLGGFKGEQNWLKLVGENLLGNHHESIAEGDQTLAKWKAEHFLSLYLLSFVLLEKYFKI